MHCAHCGNPVDHNRALLIELAPRHTGRWAMADPHEGIKAGWVWRPPVDAPITCIPCQQTIDHVARMMAIVREPAPVAESPTVDALGLPDYTGPASPAPNLKVIGPDTVCWPVTVSHAANSRIDASPLLLGDGSYTHNTDRESPVLPAEARTQVRNLLAQVGINSVRSWLSVSQARGSIGQHWRKQARAQVESALRLPQVTDWLAAQSRSEHEHEADPGQVTGEAILPGVESTVEGLDSELSYMDTDGTPEAERRPNTSLAHVPQSPSALDSGTRQRQHERLRWRVECASVATDGTVRFTSQGLTRQWERYPSGMPRGAVEVTDLNGVPIRTDLPPWPEPSAPNSPSAHRNNGESTQAARKRRERARKRAAGQVAQAAASGDVARLAAAQRAAGRTVSAAVSSHPWE